MRTLIHGQLEDTQRSHQIFAGWWGKWHSLDWLPISLPSTAGCLMKSDASSLVRLSQNPRKFTPWTMFFWKQFRARSELNLKYRKLSFNCYSIWHSSLIKKEWNADSYTRSTRGYITISPDLLIPQIPHLQVGVENGTRWIDCQYFYRLLRAASSQSKSEKIYALNGLCSEAHMQATVHDSKRAGEWFRELNRGHRAASQLLTCTSLSAATKGVRFVGFQRLFRICTRNL
jgi:hypothetical protein